MMPIDQVKVSIEVQPLRSLYSKYATRVKSPVPIRPLGLVRSASGASNKAWNLDPQEKTAEDLERLQRTLDMPEERVPDLHPLPSSGEKPVMPVAPASGSSRVQSETEPRGHTSGRGGGGERGGVASSGGAGGSGSGSVTLGAALSRSRSQLFENRLKILSHRNPPSKSNPLPPAPAPRGPKTVQLPLLKVKFDFLPHESEENRALEHTRRSLRDMLSYSRRAKHTKGMHSYQFVSPRRKTMSGVSVHRLQVARGNHRYGSSRPMSRPDCMPSSYDADRTHVPFEASMQVQRKVSGDTLGTTFRSLGSGSGSSGRVLGEEADEDTPLPETPRSLGQTRSLHSSRNSPSWPSFEDIRTLQSPLGVACPEHVHLLEKLHKKHYGSASLQGTRVVGARRGPNGMAPSTQAPVLRYTNGGGPVGGGGGSGAHVDAHSEPIVVPSHTNVECPMCNLYREIESSPCPPNTPRRAGEGGSDPDHHLNKDGLPSQRAERPLAYGGAKRRLAGREVFPTAKARSLVCVDRLEPEDLGLSDMLRIGYAKV